MALVFELYPQEGYNDFFVGDTRVQLTDIRHEFHFTLVVHKETIKAKFEVTDKRAEEILPGVRVSAGEGADISRHGVKVCIEAPRAIEVHRGTVYRKNRESGGNADA